jgi:DNA-binding transcriptional LysR family regulator
VNLDVESLRTLLAVLDWGSMSRAAEQLGMSPSAVSWKIKRLEQRAGRPLLRRDGHALRPTRDGRVLIDDARSIVATHDRMVHRLESPEFTGRITVGSNEEVGAERLAGILGRFRYMYPAATIEFIIDRSRRLVPMLERERLDVAVIQLTEEEVRPDDRVLWSEQLRWATHRDHPYDDGVVPLISFGRHGFYRPISEPILERNGIRYRYTITAPTSLVVRAAVGAGLGVAVLGERFLTGDVIEWRRVADLEALPRACQIVRTGAGESSEITVALMEAIVDEYFDLPARQAAAGA